MDEFCLEHPDNKASNRRARLIRLDEANPRFIEGKSTDSNSLSLRLMHPKF